VETNKSDKLVSHAILGSADDYKDQIQDETARQSRSAFGIGLSVAPPKFRFKFSMAPTKVGAFWFLRMSLGFESCPASQI